MDPVAEGEKKKKKRKKEKDLADGEDRSGEPKKKSKRRKTDLPDPNDDESLSDQARKALVYAYAQFSDPSSWKFNKARQNWLIRNIWSEQAIPETHVPLTIRYLTNVQGGVREKLTKACEAALDPPKPAQPSEPAAPPVETSPSAAPPPDVKQLRARAVMDALSSDSA
ncbi:hypothetical protein PLICRDRAFT_96552 [Plicaturopsis crispa FD-325 SS-3]|nr:hypothetical protein PLICRDRAFT_96552 [Plicaturopsis crispa FD-325 SS-3]